MWSWPKARLSWAVWLGLKQERTERKSELPAAALQAQKNQELFWKQNGEDNEIVKDNLLENALNVKWTKKC